MGLYFGVEEFPYNVSLLPLGGGLPRDVSVRGDFVGNELMIVRDLSDAWARLLGAGFTPDCPMGRHEASTIWTGGESGGTLEQYELRLVIRS